MEDGSESCSTHLIEGDGTFNFAGIENFLNEVKLAECGLSYAVVSIMGPQSSGSTDVTPHINTVIASGFTGNITFKDTGPIDEAVLVKQGGDAAESPGVPSYKSNQTDNKLLMDSNSKDAKTSEAMIGTSSEADNNRTIKYTFSRKRKKELSTNPNENTSVGKSNAKKRAVVEKQNGAPEPQKASLIDESSRDSRRMVQVARQLISLSGKRW